MRTWQQRVRELISIHDTHRIRRVCGQRGSPGPAEADDSWRNGPRRVRTLTAKGSKCDPESVPKAFHAPRLPNSSSPGVTRIGEIRRISPRSRILFGNACPEAPASRHHLSGVPATDSRCVIYVRTYSRRSRTGTTSETNQLPFGGGAPPHRLQKNFDRNIRSKTTRAVLLKPAFIPRTGRSVPPSTCSLTPSVWLPARRRTGSSTSAIPSSGRKWRYSATSFGSRCPVHDMISLSVAP